MRDSRSVFVAGCWSLLIAASAFGESGNGESLQAASPVYVKKPGLQETMLATRNVYAAVMPSQPDARKAVKLGPWHLAGAPVSE
jgi:hypothetical protein